MIGHQQGFALDRESAMVLGKTRFGGFFFVPCRSELAPGGVPTKDVNDTACWLEERAALEYIAGKPVSLPHRPRAIRLPNGQSLTPDRWHVLCLCFTKTLILDPSTE